MPPHPPQWTEFLQCSQCSKEFSIHSNALPTTLLCGHSVCKGCACSVKGDGCRYDPNTNVPANYLDFLPVNSALLKIVQYQGNAGDGWRHQDSRQLIEHLGDGYSPYLSCTHVVEGLAVYLQDIKNGIVPQTCELTKPMLRKVVALIQCQIALEDGRSRALRACRAIGERVATELILAHQNPATLSGNLWTAVRARGCQFLGPAMQEEALKLILLALEDGSELSRKVLVMFVVQKLQQQFPQASKTSIGHVVQLLYRASCFVVKKRDGDSSLMKLKEEFRMYQALRREHDAQVVQIAREAGLRIAPDQWSALLYGDQGHKSHMQSIIDILQSGETLKRCIQDLESALEKSNNPHTLKGLIPHFQVLAEISDDSPNDEKPPQKGDWSFLVRCLQSVKVIIQELVIFSKNHSSDCWRDEEAFAQSTKFKTSFCRDMKSKGRCPRGATCMFAHTDEELHLYRNKRKKANLGIAGLRDSRHRMKSLIREGDDGSSTNDQNERTASPAATVTMGEPGSVDSNQPIYGTTEVPPVGYSNHPVLSYPQPSLPINTISGQHPSTVPPFQYRSPLPPNFYHPFDPYGQRALYSQPQHNPVPFGTIPPPMDHCGANLAAGDQAAVNSRNTLGTNVPQFTVTLSFQSNPHQHPHLQQSTFRAPPSAPSTAFSHHPDVIAPGVGATDTNFARQMQVLNSHQVPLQRNGGFYPVQHANPDPAANSNFAPVPLGGGALATPPVELPRYQANSPAFTLPFNASGNQRVAVVAPRPMVPSPTHLYDPATNTFFPQGSPIAPKMASPVLMGPSHSPAGQSSSQPPVYIPVVPVPIAPYQLLDQAPSMQVHTQMTPPMVRRSPKSPMIRSGAICSAYEQGIHAKSSVFPHQSEMPIPRSIERATMPELERRKEQILNILIQKTKKEELPVMPEPQKSYNVWMCESYEPPFLTIATTSDSGRVMEHPQSEEFTGNPVDVVAELDTRTKQVTMRDVHHINPSHARNERTIDDEKMHRTLLETNNHMNSSTAASRAPGSYPRSILTDDFVPFTDRQMVSKYGPIARAVRTRNSDIDLVQVMASADINSQLTAAMVESTTESRGFGDSAPTSTYSSFGSLHDVSRFPVTASHSSKANSDVRTFGRSVESGDLSLSQAASNSRLLRREQVALQQNQAHASSEDLHLAMELQQIEMSIQRKKLEQRL